MAGIQIGIASETKAFKQGIESGMIDPLEDAVEALDDLGKSKGPDKLEDGFEDAQDASEKLKKETKETADTIEKEFRQSYGKMKSSSQQGTNAAKRDLDELGNEARQNAAETFSSFDGSAESFADGIQGTLGGIVSSLGPVGAALGAVGAIGIGLIMQKLTEAGEGTEAYKEKVAALGQEFIETGGLGATSIDFIVDALKDLATGTDDGEVNLKDLNKVARDSRSSFKDLAQAYAGNTDELDDLIRKGEEHKKQLEDEADALNIGVEGYSAKVQAIDEAADQQEVYNQYLRDAKTAAEQAAEAERLFVQSGGPEMEAKAQLIDTINDAYDDAAGSVDDFIVKESGLFDVDAYITSMAARTKALGDYQTNLANSSLSPEAKSALNEMGAEAAAFALAGYTAASPEQRAALNRIWSESGRENSGEYTKQLEAGIPDTMDAPKITRPVVPAADLSKVKRSLSGSHKLRVTVEAFTRSGKRVL